MSDEPRLRAIWWDPAVTRWRWSVREPGRPGASGVERTREEAETAAALAVRAGPRLALPRKRPAYRRGPRLGTPRSSELAGTADPAVASDQAHRSCRFFGNVLLRHPHRSEIAQVESAGFLGRAVRGRDAGCRSTCSARCRRTGPPGTPCRTRKAPERRFRTLRGLSGDRSQSR